MRIASLSRISRAFSCIVLTMALCLGLVGYSGESAYAVTSAEKQAEADEISAKIDALQTEINEAQAVYDEASARYKEANARAIDAANRKQAAEERIVELQDELGTIAADMYRTGGTTSFLNVLLGANSFSEFLTSWDAVESISGREADLIQESKEARAEAEAAEAEYLEQKAVAEEEMNRAEEAKNKLEATRAEMQVELDKVNEEVAILQAKEEEERIAREEAERRRAQADAIMGGNAGAGTSGSGKVVVDGWTNPLPGYYGVTNEFGWAGAWDGCYHNGIDLGAGQGSTIVSAASGTVTYVGWYGSGGKAVIVSHGNGVRSIYMHMNEWLASPGQAVSAGTPIGTVGMTGYTTGPHLHFQIEVTGTPVNPRNFIRF